MVGSEGGDVEQGQNTARIKGRAKKGRRSAPAELVCTRRVRNNNAQSAPSRSSLLE